MAAFHTASIRVPYGPSACPASEIPPASGSFPPTPPPRVYRPPPGMAISPADVAVRGPCTLRILLVLAGLAAAPALAHADSRPERELACLAEAVYFEARGTGTAGETAVAHVVVNRSNDPKFPDTRLRRRRRRLPVLLPLRRPLRRARRPEGAGPRLPRRRGRARRRRRPDERRALLPLRQGRAGLVRQAQARRHHRRQRLLSLIPCRFSRLADRPQAESARFSCAIDSATVPSSRAKPSPPASSTSSRARARDTRLLTVPIRVSSTCAASS